jgi:hypothetical protein
MTSYQTYKSHSSKGKCIYDIRKYYNRLYHRVNVKCVHVEKLGEETFKLSIKQRISTNQVTTILQT